MDAFELRRRGVELLSPVLVPYGFVYQASEVDRGSGGLYAHGGSHERTVRWNSACAMRSVRSAIASMLPRYCTDRKSTRLNSSHSQISYAVFCLKKKKNCNIEYNVTS